MDRRPFDKDLLPASASGRCFVCGIVLMRNRWKWAKGLEVRICRDRRACEWRSQHRLELRTQLASDDGA